MVRPACLTYGTALTPCLLISLSDHTVTPDLRPGCSPELNPVFQNASPATSIRPVRRTRRATRARRARTRRRWTPRAARTAPTTRTRTPRRPRPTSTTRWETAVSESGFLHGERGATQRHRTSVLQTSASHRVRLIRLAPSQLVSQCPTGPRVVSRILCVSTDPGLMQRCSVQRHFFSHSSCKLLGRDETNSPRNS